jgi:hypothetical protein
MTFLRVVIALLEAFRWLERRAVNDAPPGPVTAGESAEHALKRQEEFYKYAQAAYERIHQRWTQADDKAWRYLSILAIMLGAGAVAVGQVAKIFAGRSNLWDWLFVGAYLTAAIFSVFSFSCFLSALQFYPMIAPPSKPDMVDFFSGNNYVYVLEALGAELLVATESNRLALENKLETTKLGFGLMKVSGICLLIASVAYFQAQVRITTAANHLPAQQAPSTAPNADLLKHFPDSSQPPRPDPKDGSSAPTSKD